MLLSACQHAHKGNANIYVCISMSLHSIEGLEILYNTQHSVLDSDQPRNVKMNTVHQSLLDNMFPTQHLRITSKHDCSWVKQGLDRVHCVKATPTCFSVLVCDCDVQLMFEWPRFLSSLIKQALLTVWEVTGGDKDHTFVQSLRMFALMNAAAAKSPVLLYIICDILRLPHL